MNAQTTEPSIEKQILAMLEHAQKMIRQEYIDKGYTFAVPTLTIEPGGKRFAKIAITSLGQKSVYCFVDLTNGDVLKAAGWKAPAKGARGSVFNFKAIPFDSNGSCFYRR